MYSASDFEKFSGRVLSSAEARAKRILAEASEQARKLLKDTEIEAEKRYEEGLLALKKEAEAFEKEARAKIETAARTAWQRELAERKASVMEALENRMEREFETLAGCFTDWLASRYEEGRLELYERLPREGLEKFEVTPVPGKIVRLTKGNLIVAFTPASAAEEFAPLVDEILVKSLKEKE